MTERGAAAVGHAFQLGADAFNRLPALLDVEDRSCHDGRRVGHRHTWPPAHLEERVGPRLRAGLKRQPAQERRDHVDRRGNDVLGQQAGQAGRLRLDQGNRNSLEERRKDEGTEHFRHPSQVIGRRIEILVDLHRVRAVCDGRLVADHQRVWAWHQTIHDAEHVAAARTLRRERVGILRPVLDPTSQIEVEQRPLSDYDTALGLSIDGTGDPGVA